MSEVFTGDYAPELFDEKKRYYLLQAQELASLTDAELRDMHEMSNTFTRRVIQGQVGDSVIDNGFLIRENLSDNSNNFSITGGDGTLDNPGVLFLKGHRLFLRNSIAYTDQTSSTGTITDDFYTETTLPALTTPTGALSNLKSIAGNSGVLVVVGSDGTALKSVDAGQNFLSIPDATQTFNAACFADSSNAFAVGLGGLIIKSTNAGNSWGNNYYPPEDLYGVSFINANYGFVVGFNGAIYSTHDGGNHWSSSASGTTSTLYSVDYANDSTAWTVGGNGVVAYTINASDGVVIWQLQLNGTLTTNQLNSVFALNTTTALVCGNNGTILQTSDSGTTWTIIASDTTSNLYGLYFENANSGWAVGANGIITQSVDGGNTWASKVIDSSATFRSVFFTDTTGFVVGDSGIIYRTLDGTAWEKYRTDYVYMDFHLAEVSADTTSNSEYIDTSLEDLVVGLPSANRLRVVQDVKVSEGWPMPADYLQDGTVQHYTYPLAKIQRTVGKATINQADITDLRIKVRTISELDEVLRNGGIDSSSIAAGAVTPDKMDPNGDYTLGSLQVQRDATIAGDLNVLGVIHVQDIRTSTIFDDLTVSGSATVGDSTGIADSIFNVYGQINQQNDISTSYNLYSSAATGKSPVFNIEQDGTGSIFKIQKLNDSTYCVFDITTYGNGYDFCISHLGNNGGVLSALDDSTGNSFLITKDATGALGSVFNISSNAIGPIFNIANQAVGQPVSVKIDQTGGTVIRVSAAGDASSLDLHSYGAGTDLTIQHDGASGYVINITSSATAAINVNNLAGQVGIFNQQDNKNLFTLNKDSSGSGRALEINHQGWDPAIQINNDGSGIGMHVSHVGQSLATALDIFVGGNEQGIALQVNKSNDASGQAVYVHNQGLSQALVIVNDNTSSVSNAFELTNLGYGLDMSAVSWRIDNSGNFFTKGDVTTALVAFDQTHLISSDEMWLDPAKFDATNPGLAGRVFVQQGFLRFSDGTTGLPDPSFGGGTTGPTGPVGPTGAYGGPTGATGPAGSPAEIPSNYVTLGATFDTTSTDWVDIGGDSTGLFTFIGIDSDTPIYASMSVETDTTGPHPWETGSFLTLEYRIIIGDSTGISLARYVSGDDDIEISSVEHRTEPMFGGNIYPVRGQVRVAANTSSKTARINAGQLYVQSLQGNMGNVGPTGATGFGVTGPTGSTGFGATGATGPIGIVGPTGPYAPAAEIPTTFITLDGTAQSTTSPTFVDIPGLSSLLTLDSSSKIFANMTFEAASSGIGDPVTGAFRIVIHNTANLVPDTTSTDLRRFISSIDDLSIGSVEQRTFTSPPGDYLVKGQFQRAAGTRTLVVNDAQIFAEALVGAKGDLGATGIAGNTGIQGTTGISTAGYTGIQGSTGTIGIQGNTGSQGITGTAGGATGIQGVTGLFGLDGQTGVQGQTGPSGGPIGETGLQGPAGQTGIQGLGLTGLQGFTGIRGATGLQGGIGIQGVTGFGVTGIQGSTGIQGLGVTGLQGVTGIIGTTGFGIQGATGLQGIIGPQGTIGIQGVTGIQGNIGIQGATGILGVTGLQGIVGEIGQTGIQGLGLTGIQGIQGYQGYTGSIGNTGIQGITGLGITGIAGETGIAGQTGVQGQTGPFGGPPGETGIAGQTGVQGQTGPLGGPIGETGIQGIQGVLGQTGIQGITGINGSTGIDGSTGIQGIIGIQGITGINGSTGIQGTIGTQGQTGVRGITGIGTTGIQGVTGPIGEDGLQGPTGYTGIQGTTGPLGGPQGQTGVQGQTGPYGGPTGPTGIQGQTGTIGQTGAQGYTGPIGQTGLQGGQGLTGTIGQTGAQGNNGPIGFQGYTGIQGLTGFGIQGIEGQTGIQGLTGIQGSTGIQGFTGIGTTGIQGITGSQGLTGLGVTGLLGQTGLQGGVGPIGFQGFTGVKGVTGIQGDIGIQGVTGIIGSTGIQGGIGIQGTTGFGIQGSTGLSGATGFQGVIGIQGTTGFGIQGVTGLIGSTGILGIQGTTGFGIQGATGLNGVTGFMGVTGIQGMTGALGNTGIQGITGNAGAIQCFDLNGISNPSSTNKAFLNTGLYSAVVGKTPTQFKADSSTAEYSTVEYVAEWANDGNENNFVKAISNYGIFAMYEYPITPLTTNPGLITKIIFDAWVKSSTDASAYPQFEVWNDASASWQLISQGSVNSGADQELTSTFAQGPYNPANFVDSSNMIHTRIRMSYPVMSVNQLFINYNKVCVDTRAIGAQGSTGVQGVTGPFGGATGIQGLTGIQGIGFTGLQGSTGLLGSTGISGGLSGVIFGMSTSRYPMVTDTGEEVWGVSASTVFPGLAWDRSGTNLNIYRNGHGHSTGNMVIVRNTNQDFLAATIDATTSNSFSLVTTNSGGTSGNNGAYSLGFTYAHTGSPSTGGVLTAPTGDHADCVLLSLKINTGTRVSTTYDLTLPAGATNSAGGDSYLGDCNPPDFNIRIYGDTMSAIGATMITNSGSIGYNVFKFGNLSSASIIDTLILHF